MLGAGLVASATGPDLISALNGEEPGELTDEFDEILAFIQFVRDGDSAELRKRLDAPSVELLAVVLPRIWNEYAAEFGQPTKVTPAELTADPNGQRKFVFRLEHGDEQRFLIVNARIDKVSRFELEATWNSPRWFFGPVGEREFATLAGGDKRASVHLSLKGKPQKAKELFLRSTAS